MGWWFGSMQDKFSLNDIIQLLFPAQLKTGLSDHYLAQGNNSCSTKIGAFPCLNLHNKKKAIFNRVKAEYTTQDYSLQAICCYFRGGVDLLQNWTINELYMLVYKQKRPHLSIQMMLFIYAINTICSHPQQFKQYYQRHFARPYDHKSQQREQEEKEKQSKQEQSQDEQENENEK